MRQIVRWLPRFDSLVRRLAQLTEIWLVVRRLPRFGANGFLIAQLLQDWIRLYVVAGRGVKGVLELDHSVEPTRH